MGRMVLAFRVVPGLLFLAYLGLLLFQGARWWRREKVERRSGWRDRFAIGLFALGHVPALLYFGTHLMDPFYLYVPPVLRVWGVSVLLAGEILFVAAIWALGANWSPLLEIRRGHTLTIRGPYCYLRHPLYAAFFIMGFGLLALSGNWPVGAAFLAPLALLYVTRVPDEENMLREHFGDAYRAYEADTDRLLPRGVRRLLGKRWGQAAVATPIVLGIAACGAIALDGLSDELHKADVAVVLGSQVFANGEPGPSLTSRLNATIRLYREGWFSDILVSGGVGRNGHDEAVVMRRYLVARGIPGERVHTDSLGVNTRATARNAVAFMKERGMGSAMVVTQFYHVPRSRIALRRAGAPAVYGAHARFFEWHDIYAVPRELVALVWYRLRGSGA